MPEPPRKGETKAEFLKRCIGDEGSKREHPDARKRYGFCNGYWSNNKAAADDAQET
jgi:hypothetical protein